MGHYIQHALLALCLDVGSLLLVSLVLRFTFAYKAIVTVNSSPADSLSTLLHKNGKRLLGLLTVNQKETRQPQGQ